MQCNPLRERSECLECSTIENHSSQQSPSGEQMAKQRTSRVIGVENRKDTKSFSVYRKCTQ